VGNLGAEPDRDDHRGDALSAEPQSEDSAWSELGAAGAEVSQPHRAYVGPSELYPPCDAAKELARLATSEPAALWWSETWPPGLTRAVMRQSRTR